MPAEGTALAAGRAVSPPNQESPAAPAASALPSSSAAGGGVRLPSKLNPSARIRPQPATRTLRPLPAAGSPAVGAAAPIASRASPLRGALVPAPASNPASGATSAPAEGGDAQGKISVGSAAVWELMTLVSMRTVLSQAVNTMSQQFSGVLQASLAQQLLGGAAGSGAAAGGASAASAQEAMSGLLAQLLAGKLTGAGGAPAPELQSALAQALQAAAAAPAPVAKAASDARTPRKAPGARPSNSAVIASAVPYESPRESIAESIADSERSGTDDSEAAAAGGGQPGGALSGRMQEFVGKWQEKKGIAPAASPPGSGRAGAPHASCALSRTAATRSAASGDAADAESITSIEDVTLELHDAAPGRSRSAHHAGGLARHHSDSIRSAGSVGFEDGLSSGGDDDPRGRRPGSSGRAMPSPFARPASGSRLRSGQPQVLRLHEEASEEYYGGGRGGSRPAVRGGAHDASEVGDEDNMASGRSVQCTNIHSINFAFLLSCCAAGGLNKTTHFVEHIAPARPLSLPKNALPCSAGHDPTYLLRMLLCFLTSFSFISPTRCSRELRPSSPTAWTSSAAAVRSRPVLPAGSRPASAAAMGRNASQTYSEVFEDIEESGGTHERCNFLNDSMFVRERSAALLLATSTWLQGGVHPR